MSFQDLYGGGFGPAMPVPQSAVPQGPQPSPLGSLASGGMSALRYLLPAMFAGARSSTAAPSQNNAAPAQTAPAAQPGMAPPGVTGGMGNPGAPGVPPPQPRPQMAGPGAPMSIAPPNPGAAQPNPSLQSSNFGASPASMSAGIPGGASNPSLVQSFINSMRGAQPLQAPAQQPQAPAAGGQGQGILPKGINDISQLMKLFGGGAGGAAAGAGAGGGFTGALSGLF